jgi:hypothetical protein
LDTLSDEEVSLWGNTARSALVFYEFTECRLTCDVPASCYSTATSVTSDDGKPIVWRGLFEGVMTQLDDDQELDTATKIFDVEIFAPLLVNGVKPSKFELSAKVRRIKQPVPIDTVLKYSAPDAADDILAQVQKHTGDIVEVIQSSDNVALVSNSANLIVPPDCFFRYLWMDMGRPVNVEWVKVVSADLAMQSDVKISIVLRCSPNRAPDD